MRRVKFPAGDEHYFHNFDRKTLKLIIEAHKDEAITTSAGGSGISRKFPSYRLADHI